jgi:transcriptional regulator
MYLPTPFERSDIAALQALVDAHPLAMLVTQRAGEPVVDHIPMLLDAGRGPHGTLVGHVARANPLWRAPGTCLAVFRGPQAYISPSWYPSKREHGKAVPTWNYAVAHAHGTLRVFEDAAALRSVVERLTERHEAGQPSPWRVSDAPTDYLEAMLQAIVGIELPIERIQGKFKLSQNRGAADRTGAEAGLRDHPGCGDGAALADWMQREVAR